MSANNVDFDDMENINLPSSELESLVKTMLTEGIEVTENIIGDGAAGEPVNEAKFMNRSGKQIMFHNAAPNAAVNHRSMQGTSVVSEEPFVEITEQPKARGLRFRYECEGRSAGSIPGETSTPERKTYPTIKIHNYQGPSIIVVSCVTKETAPNCKPHPHSLVGKDCKRGVCTVKVRDTNIVSFPHLGIQCAKKKDVEGALKLRKEINVDPYQTGFDHPANSYDLNVVRLCFQVFLPDASGRITRIVPPVVSQPIHDKKSLNELVICRIDHSSGKARGGDEVFLLCEKVNKEDIQVRFYEEKMDQVLWEDFGDFGQGDVHRQYAIVFKTPSYRDIYITRPLEVQMQLRRPSDGEVSEPVPFTYMPEDPDPDRIEEKRRRKAERFTSLLGNAGPSAAANSSQGATGQGLNIKENLRNKLKANRRIKQENVESTAMEQDNELPRYSINNTGAKNPAMVTSNYRTADNTTMGSVMTLAQPNPLQLQQFPQSVPVSQPMPAMNFPQGQVVLSGEDGQETTTIDLQMLHDYLQDHGQGEAISFPESLEGLSGNLLNLQYDPNIGAMENVGSDSAMNAQAMIPQDFNEANQAINALTKS